MFVVCSSIVFVVCSSIVFVVCSSMVSVVYSSTVFVVCSIIVFVVRLYDDEDVSVLRLQQPQRPAYRLHHCCM